MNQAVTEYIQRLQPGWQAEVCAALRQIVREAIPDVEERIQYGKPHFLKNGHYACVLTAAKGWVSFTLFNAQSVQPPEGLFEASADGTRKTIKIRAGQAVDADLLARLLRQTAQG